VGVGIVAIGGGGIQPMRDRWQRALIRVDQEAPRLKREAQGATDTVRKEMDEVRVEIDQPRGGEEMGSTTDTQSY
jgi:hypothetical protein